MPPMRTGKTRRKKDLVIYLFLPCLFERIGCPLRLLTPATRLQSIRCRVPSQSYFRLPDEFGVLLIRLSRQQYVQTPVA